MGMVAAETSSKEFELVDYGEHSLTTSDMPAHKVTRL
jgi:hypothetical protein